MPIDDDLDLPARDARIRWFKSMQEAIDSRMSAAQIAEFERWEKEHVKGDGEYGSSDWPGWERLIGPPPWKYEQN